MYIINILYMFIFPVTYDLDKKKKDKECHIAFGTISRECKFVFVYINARAWGHNNR